MARKKVKVRKPRINRITAIAETDYELRRWCVELALRWPTITEYGTGGAVGGSRTIDADVIGRAEKIRQYVIAEKP
jgi:hypothetical protein